MTLEDENLVYPVGPGEYSSYIDTTDTDASGIKTNFLKIQYSILNSTHLAHMVVRPHLLALSCIHAFHSYSLNQKPVNCSIYAMPCTIG